MLEELRVNPRSPGARLSSRRPGERAVSRSARVDPNLSTGFPGITCELGADLGAPGHGFPKQKEGVE